MWWLGRPGREGMPPLGNLSRLMLSNALVFASWYNVPTVVYNS